MSVDPPWLTPKPAVVQQRYKLAIRGFVEPRPWPCDGGSRREPVLDMDVRPPRVVRYVGWRRCMSCQKPFWSEDLARLRLCERCKSPEHDLRQARW